MSAENCIQVINELGSLLIAFATGAYTLKYMNLFFRLIFVQVVFWLLCYTLSYALTSYQRMNGIPPNNQWLMNIHLAGETVLLLAAAFVAFKQKASRMALVAAIAVFIAVVAGEAAVKGAGVYFNYADVTECVLMTLVYGALLFGTVTARKAGSRGSPVAILCTGLLIYFACSVPIMAVLHVLQQRDPEAGSFLFHLIIDVIANLRYLFTAVAFWLVRRNTIH